MENKTEPAIAVLPYQSWKTFNLNSLSLDLLEWPLGRPDRLKNGTIRDMIKNDHLITFPRKSVFLFPRPLIKAKISVMIVEPDAIHNLYINISKYLHWRFYKILTKNKYLLEEIHNTSFFYFGSTFIQNSDKIDLQKKNMASLIASNQNKLTGHKLRHEVVQHIKNNNFNVSVIGRGYRPFENKEDGLKSYRYSIVIENNSELDYFTEKVIDACLLETIPIYWGAPNIAKYFDTRGFIVCENIDQILQAIRTISIDDYNSKVEWIMKNKVKAAYHANCFKRAAQVIRSSL
ncbi:glycosyltransferase family 10 [Amylibacter sp.]|nr:glycosyltransferase family 10 [Amylibacter sp.]MDB4133227.1 glycosyltransferase family 10 [Amylibacter sp.]